MSSPISYLLAACLLLFFFNSHGYSKANFLASPDCPITKCSTNGLEFHYPFWKMEDSSADQYCGYPGFGINCSDSGEPILGLPNNDSFYVRDIDFTLSTITLVDIDVVYQTCPRATHSMSVGTLPLDYSPLDVNLSFHFNCSFYVDPVVTPITCLGSYGTKKSYVFKEGDEPEGFDWSENCEENVVVTVKETEITRSTAINELSGAFGVAMNNGFVLNWTMAKECGSCETNGGFCGYNNIAREVLCFCKDDTQGSIGTPTYGLCRKAMPMFKPNHVFRRAPFFVIFYLFMLPSLHCEEDPRYTQCKQPFNCGDITNISYPFWGGTSRPQECGRSGFELNNCEDETQLPRIKIENLDFHVSSISNQELFHTMTLARSDLWDSPCTQLLVNTTLNYTRFSYVQTVRNLTLYYGCVPQQDQSIPNNFTCRTENTTKDISYYLDDSLSRVVDDLLNRSACVAKIRVPIFWADFDNMTENATAQVENVLRQGFQVEFSADWDLCRGCMNSKGTCVSNAKTDSFLCLCGDQFSNSTCPIHRDTGARNWKRKVVIGVTAAGALTVLLSVIAVSVRCIKTRISETRNDQCLEAFVQNNGPLAVKRYKFSDIKKMTNSFQDKLGKGGYGDVYKGHLLDGFPVAVKVLNESKGNGEDFVNEVASISRTSHVNVVTLLGYCFEGKKKALIYEFMPNGSLEKFIYKDTDPLKTNSHLELEKLFQISTGIARGLEYLHRGCNTRILHFDIKPHNILLDEKFCPKISDFGLSKLCTRKESIISMLDARGTIGYIAPEVFCRNFGGVSAKSDVYSYGMMILEMVGGRKNIDARVSHTSEIYFPDWVYEHLEQGSNFGLVNAVTEEEKEIARKMILVGLWCIQTRPSDRPSMSKVIEMLEGSIEALQTPPKPVLSSPVRSSLPKSTTLSTIS